MVQRSNTKQEHVLVIVLVVVFGGGSWISVVGIWTELPILIANGMLPEEYRITSIAHILIQFAFIGTIGFFICNKLSESSRIYRPEIPVNYAITFMGTIATFLLIFFWDSQLSWSSQCHSVGFLSLLFCVALVDVTSNTTFVGYMSLLKANFLNWFWLGVGLSHILPACVVLIQQSSGGGQETCIANVTVMNKTIIGNASRTYECTSWQEMAPEFLFEPGHYFGFMFLIMFACHISFICLNTLSCARREYGPQRDGHHLKRDGCGGLFQAPTRDALPTADQEYEYVKLLSVDPDSADETEVTILGKDDNTRCGDITERPLTNKQVVFLYTALFLNFSISYGIAGPTFGYSGSAYGSYIFQILVPLKEIAVALAYFCFLLRPIYSFKVVTVYLVLALLGYSYVLIVACMSPHPPFSGLVIGKVLIVLIGVGSSMCSRYCHASTVWILRNNPNGRKHLIVSGVIGQAGVFLASTTMFVLINTFEVFEAYRESDLCPTNLTCTMIY